MVRNSTNCDHPWTLGKTTFIQTVRAGKATAFIIAGQCELMTNHVQFAIGGHNDFVASSALLITTGQG